VNGPESNLTMHQYINFPFLYLFPGVQKLLGPEFWRGSPAGSRGPLGEGREVTWPLSALPPMSGTPDEVTSDHCLGQLLSECGISPDCWSAETSGTAQGYSLTHRLMFLQTARQVRYINGLPIAFK
jgi:hypothetical protein